MAQRQISQKLTALRRLAKHSHKEVLTTYLSAEKPGEMIPKNLLAQLHSMSHSYLSPEQKEQFSEDLSRIENHLKNYQPATALTVAFFTDSQGLWQQLDFDFAVQPYMMADNEPYLTPINLAVDSQQSYVVLLVNKKRARLLNIKLGEIAENVEIKNPEHIPDVKLVRNEGMLGGQNKAFRHTQKYLSQYLKNVGKATAEFAKKTNARYVIIGSHREMLGRLKGILPSRLRGLVRGELIALPDMPTTQVLLKAREVAMTMGVRPASRLPHRL